MFRFISLLCVLCINISDLCCMRQKKDSTSFHYTFSGVMQLGKWQFNDLQFSVDDDRVSVVSVIAKNADLTCSTGENAGNDCEVQYYKDNKYQGTAPPGGANFEKLAKNIVFVFPKDKESIVIQVKIVKKGNAAPLASGIITVERSIIPSFKIDKSKINFGTLKMQGNDIASPTTAEITCTYSLANDAELIIASKDSFALSTKGSPLTIPYTVSLVQATGITGISNDQTIDVSKGAQKNLKLQLKIDYKPANNALPAAGQYKGALTLTLQAKA